MNICVVDTYQGTPHVWCHNWKAGPHSDEGSDSGGGGGRKGKSGMRVQNPAITKLNCSWVYSFLIGGVIGKGLVEGYSLICNKVCNKALTSMWDLILYESKIKILSDVCFYGCYVDLVGFVNLFILITR